MTKEEPTRSRRGTSSRGAGSGLVDLVVLAILLLIPAIALSRLATSIDWRLLIGVPVAVSIYAFLAYRADKRRAQSREWRIPESTLHTAEILGGWPGAFLAQRIFRHKTSKASFQSVFWLIVFAHEYVAFDSLLQWKFTRALLQMVSG